MKAIVAKRYGGPDVLQYTNVATPSPKPSEILIRVRAASINSMDHRLMHANPFFVRLMGNGMFRPRRLIPGGDIAGIIEAVGEAVTRFKVGDEVYGDIAMMQSGAYAEYACVPETASITRKPKNMSFEQAAAVPIAGVTALQALQDHAKIKAGDKVLINGASGGVGTFAVMIAKALGAEVTGVCSTRNVDLVRSIGADHVVDYRIQDVTKLGKRCNVIIDIAANLKAKHYKQMLLPDGRGILVGFSTIAHIVGISMKSKRLQKQHNLYVKAMGSASTTPGALDELKNMMESGRITPSIDKSYPLENTADAMRYFENEHARAKVVITV